MSLSNMIKVLKTVQFGTLYIKPAFVFADNNGHLKLQFEADPYSSMGYLYDNLCQMLGVKWNYISPYNSLGLYTSCAMHAAGDRATYGCGPSNANSGGFCPQMTIAYSPKFKSQDAAASYISAANNYVNYWRSLYPYGVAVGTDTFCKSKSSSGYKGGCLGLFLNRMDLYYVLAPDLSGAWVEFNGNIGAPTHSPAPTYPGGCDDPRNFHLDKCFRKKYGVPISSARYFWVSLNKLGQLSVISVLVMSMVFSVAFWIVRLRRRHRRAVRKELKRILVNKKRRKRGDERTSSRATRSSRSRSRSSKRNSRRSKTGLGTHENPFDNKTEARSYHPPALERSLSKGSARRSDGSETIPDNTTEALGYEPPVLQRGRRPPSSRTHSQDRSRRPDSQDRSRRTESQERSRRTESQDRSRRTHSQDCSPSDLQDRGSISRRRSHQGHPTHPRPPRFQNLEPIEPPISLDDEPATGSASLSTHHHQKPYEDEEYKDPVDHPSFYLT
jgi:hypothetical protein